jgi:2-oxoglutarate decarboxylase
VLIHGDAAFAGQGVVAETLNLSQLDGYSTGGTIHLIINNQIGFTTLPDESRSTPYSTDVARGVQAPIFHVNGDRARRPPSGWCRWPSITASKFKKDVVIDMICYRRHGHNEGDDPSYTQPILYRKIKEHPSVAKQYGERLVREGVLTAEEWKPCAGGFARRLEEAYDAVQKKAEHFELQELSLVTGEDYAGFCPRTAVNQQVLERVIRGSTQFPESFHLHPKLRGFVEKRREAWSRRAAHRLGFRRGPGFRHAGAGRHSRAAQRPGFRPRHLQPAPPGVLRFRNRQALRAHAAHRARAGRFDVFDSSLSEYAVLGFEFGYSVADPLTLVIWEAQFGDFANGAQIMIDQFISCCEQKWGQPSGLVMLLPHGFEGQGPEHSSARIERYLTLCAENNMLVCQLHHPGAIFPPAAPPDVRRPDRRGTRKPLVIFTPKSLLRHPRAVSTLHDFSPAGSRNPGRRPVADVSQAFPGWSSAPARSITICCGARGAQGRSRGAGARGAVVPLRRRPGRDILARYPATAEVVWARKSRATWARGTSCATRSSRCSIPPNARIRYVGRPESASPATGSGKRHQQEQAEDRGPAAEIGAPQAC